MASSDGFAVDPAALSDAHAGIGRLLQDMTESIRLKPNCSPSVFGHAELAASAEEFTDRWRNGVAGLVSDTESIHQRLGETVEEYLRLEETVVGRFGGDDVR